MKPDRRAIMLDARRRYLSRQRPGLDPLPWAECLRRAWAAHRSRHTISVQMDEIARAIRAHRPLLGITTPHKIPSGLYL